MDRRQLITRACSLTAIAGANSIFGLTLSGCSDDGGKTVNLGELDNTPEGLAGELAHLANPHFDQYAHQHNGDDLYQSLLQKGVVSDTGELSEGGVAVATELDAVVEYQGFYYTETELELYGLAYLLAAAA